jgi:transglutaminase-like putative cysteine protease
MRYAVISPIRLIGSLAVFVFVLNTALAKDDGTDTSITIEKDVRTHVINSDGSFIATNEIVLLINEERAIKAYSQRPLSYNRTLESLDVVEAYTQKPDGRKIVVRADQIKEQQERGSSDAPMFQDTLVKVVIFPEVAVGDRLIIQFKTHRTTALFPQQFEALSYPAFHPTDQYTLIYDLPQSMPLHADTQGFKASDPVVAAGRTIYRWDYIPGKKARIENGSVSYQDYGQYLAVSTFADFGVFAEAYDSRAKSRVTAEISELAKTITAPLDNPRDKAIALSDWVRKNIRYVAVYIGAGSVVPNPVDTILANRYGDCKDHVALLQSLLDAVAIESTPALINSDNAYTLPKVPTLGVLNHVITYIPSLDLYLDSTAEAIAGGYLPIFDLDKPVVFSKSGTLGRTPSTQEILVQNDTVFKVSANGDADFTHSSRITGWAAEFNRYAINSMSPIDRNQLVQNVLASYGQTGKGKFSATELETSDNEISIKMVGRSEKLVGLPGPTGVSTMSSFAGGIAQSVFAFSAESDRVQSFTCISGVTEEQARFEFAKGVSIVAVPNSMTLRHEKFEYTASYLKEPDAVVVRRHLKFNNPSAVCSPDDFKGMSSVIGSMVSDLKSQIVVQVL